MYSWNKGTKIMNEYNRLPGIIKIVLFVFTFTLLFNIGFALESEERIVSSFDMVRATGRMKVFLKKGQKERVKIEAEGVEISKVYTETEEKILKIYTPKGYVDEDVDIKVYVTYKELSEVHSSALAVIKADTTIRGDKLVVGVSSKGKADIKVDVDTLELMVTVSGNLKISGSAETQNAIINSDGSLKAFELKCDKTYIKINTGGVAEINAGDLLEATVHTGGNLRLKGKPLKETIKTSVGGTITRIAD
jgi:hypothetical protein